MLPFSIPHPTIIAIVKIVIPSVAVIIHLTYLFENYVYDLLLIKVIWFVLIKLAVLLASDKFVLSLFLFFFFLYFFGGKEALLHSVHQIFHHHIQISLISLVYDVAPDPSKTKLFVLEGALEKSKMTFLEGVAHTGPICALSAPRTSDEIVLSGEGPTLSAYNFRTGKKVYQRKIFERNKIHGIKLYEEAVPINVAIFGGRSLTVLPYEKLNDSSYPVREYGVGDWILAVEFSIDGTKLYCLTTHNVVCTIDVYTMKLVGTKNCGWKSILYSGCIRSLKSGQVIICSGTVMDGILVWNLEDSDIRYNLKGHEGSIFDAEISPCGDYLISCSDDRSIKAWDLSSGNLMATGWGHGARIWGLSFFDMNDQGFKIFSCSEDCTARVWQCRMDSTELIQLKDYLSHTGRDVWSQCVNEKLEVGFTGGADGKLRVYDLNEVSKPGHLTNSFTISTIALQSGQVMEEEEIIRSYYDFGYGLLAVSSTGKFFVVESNFNHWKFLFQDLRFGNFVMLTGFRNSTVAIAADKLGHVYAFKFDESANIVQKVEFQILDLSRLGNLISVQTDDGKFLLLVDSQNPKEPLLFIEIDPTTLRVSKQQNLAKPQEKILASTAILDSTNTGYLVVGCRYCMIVLYDLSDGGSPTAYYKNKVKGDTVSHFELRCANPETRELSLYTTMKDGRYYIIKINKDHLLEIVADNRLKKRFVEGCFVDLNDHLILYGFKSTYFYIWDETCQYEMLRVECGGPHRQWSFKHDCDSAGLLKYRFIFTRATEIQLMESRRASYVEVLESGLHGREVRSMTVVDGSAENEKLLISGGEDTTVKLSVLNENGSIKQLWTQRQHGSGLQSVHKVNNDYVLSSSAREELYLWKIHREEKQNSCMSLYQTVKPLSTHPDLRVMDFDTMEVKSDGKVVGFVVSAVYSDSQIRVWYFNYDENTFRILVEDRYRSCCILSVHFVVFGENVYIMMASTNGNITVYEIGTVLQRHFRLVGTNDACHLTLQSQAFEDYQPASKLGVLAFDQHIHQSSIKDLDFSYTSASNISIVTGGDDNGIALSRLKMEGGKLSLDILSFIPDAAASTVTCVCLVNSKSVLIASVDQKVRLWGFENSTLTLIEDDYTTVADTGCVTLAKFTSGKKLCLIGGAGVSSWIV